MKNKQNNNKDEGKPFVRRIFQKNLNKWFLIFLCIFIGGLFFRFYNTPNRYGFDYDASRDSLVSLAAARHLYVPLVGPPTSVGAFTFGPWYYYQLIFGTILFGAYGAWISMGVLSLFAIFVMYKIGAMLEDVILGLIFAALSAFSTSQIILGTGLSNPNSVLFFTTLSFLFFLLYLKKSWPFWFFILWGFVMGVGLFDHYQMISIFVLPVIAFIYKRKKIFIYGIEFIFGLIIAYSPLILFDISHKWQTIRAIVYYGIHGTSNPIYVPNSWKIYLLDFWPQFWSKTLGVPTIIGVVTIFFVIILIGFGLYKRKLKTEIILVLVAFAINFLYFRYYKGERVIYYLYFLMPFVLILTGYAIWLVSKFGKYMIYLSIVLLLVLLAFAFPRNIEQLSPPQSHKEYTAYAQEILRTNQNNPVILFNCGKVRRERTYGITYILSLQNKISETGKKFGLFDAHCPQLIQKQILQDNAKVVKLSRNNQEELRLVDLSSFSTETLVHSGWLPVTPERIYDNMTVLLDNK